MSIPLEETSRKLICGQILSLITKVCYTLLNYNGKKILYVTIFSKIQLTTRKLNEFLVSKETVVLRRWERSKQKFGFIKRVDKG